MEQKVLILMATYNGERYIREQLRSIIQQSYKNWELCISDDGSNDLTLEIIREFSNEDNRILPVLQNNKRHGACLNFYHLFRYAQKNKEKYQYFLCCDQDDIWEENKIFIQIQKAKEDEEGRPMLIYSDLKIISSVGNELHKMSEMQNIRLKNPIDIFFNQIFVWGNTTMFNRRLLDIMVVPQDINNSMSHDHYLAFYAAAFGKIIYIDAPLVKYRRYETNVSDLPHKYSIWSAGVKFFKEWKCIVDKHASNYNNILYFINNAPEEDVLMDIKKCYQKGGFTALNIIKKYNVSVGANKYNCIAKIIILFLKIYKKSSFFNNGLPTN